MSNYKNIVETCLNNIVLIGDYDCFYSKSVIIDGKLLSDEETQIIATEITYTKYDALAEYFNKRFPNKVVIYACDGSFYLYYNGEEINLETALT